MPDRAERQRVYSTVKDLTFSATTKWIREQGSLPTPVRVKKYALAFSGGQDSGLDDAELEKLSGEIAQSIDKNYDPSKTRHATRDSRADKAQRAIHLTQFYQAELAGGNAPNVRALAERFGVSKSTVGRILAKAGATPKRSAKTEDLSQDAKKLVLACRDMLPDDGRCIATMMDLSAIIDQEMYRTPAQCSNRIMHLADEVVAARIGFHFHFLESGGVVISAGRRIDLLGVADWHAKVRATASRSFSQTALVGKNAVERDLLSVLIVAVKSQSAPAWRDFLLATLSLRGASVLSEVGELSLVDQLSVRDPASFVYLVERARNVTKALDVADAFRILGDSVGLRDAPRGRAMNRLAELADALNHRVEAWSPFADVLKFWMDATAYRRRVAEGQLLGRNATDIDVFLVKCGDIAEFEELEEALCS